jgi:hypothetical protein
MSSRLVEPIFSSWGLDRARPTVEDFDRLIARLESAEKRVTR